MSFNPQGSVVGELRRTVLRSEADNLADDQLLEVFLTHGEHAAFEAIVRRHGPMVLGVCRRILQHAHDAEDAFQATFLVLMRKAGSIIHRDVLGPWLHGVAHRIAVRAKTLSARRRLREREAGEGAEPVSPPESPWQDLELLLDQELHRLPSKYQTPLVLCELQGLSRKEAAQRLGLPEGTLSSRLARGRDLLKTRLVRRGVTVGSGAWAALVAQSASAALPPVPASATAFSPRVLALAKGAIGLLLVTKLQMAACAVLALGLVCVGFAAGTGKLGSPQQQTALLLPTAPELAPPADPAVEDEAADDEDDPPAQPAASSPSQPTPSRASRLPAHQQGKTVCRTHSGKLSTLKTPVVGAHRHESACPDQVRRAPVRGNLPPFGAFPDRSASHQGRHSR
jgi:RNA polymerase sigma factor (sigma-70 family)